ncbi:7-alpha-hydroxycholest-4-en-3-one 12-alpha-hydroxylase [Colletotrichum asianum]
MGIFSETAGFLQSVELLLMSDLARNYDSRIVTAILLLLILPLTYTYTFAQSHFARTSKKDVAESPQVPYLVPFLGNTYAFASGPAAFFAAVRKTFKNIPARVLLGGQRMYLIPHGEHIQTLFKSSHHLNAEYTTIIAFRDALGLPDKELQELYADQSGIDTTPAPGYEHMEAKHRIFFQIHKHVHAHFAGRSLEAITSKFIESFSSRMLGENAESKLSDQWLEQPDLHDLVRTEIFHAATEAFSGDHIFRLCPNLCKEFWEFDEALPSLISGTPKFLNGKALAARAVLLQNIKTWHKFARDTFDGNDIEAVQAEWEPIYGARIMRERQKMFKNIETSEDGSASYDLGLIWASSGNVIAASFWCLFFILKDPALKKAVIEETTSCFRQGTLMFDSERLYSRPLLQSVYLETLRLSVAAPVTRISRVPKFQLGKWTVKKDEMMFATTWVASRDTTFWNRGKVDYSTGKAEHEVDAFWAERFLEFEDDLGSGPVRKSDSTSAGIKPLDAGRLSKAKVVETGMQGYYYPFGGGSKMCPGRFFAKRQILVTVALMLRAFDIELLDPITACKTEPSMPMTPVGTVRPNVKTAFRIRKRDLD